MINLYWHNTKKKRRERKEIQRTERKEKYEEGRKEKGKKGKKIQRKEKECLAQIQLLKSQTRENPLCILI